MTELELYKFVEENGIEFHWNGDDVYMFVDCRDTKDFTELLGSGILDESGIECRMKEGYFCFEMKDICDYFGIELENVFKKEE